jgi:DNA repair exonuclease SbcCD ATPase subunit
MDSLLIAKEDCDSRSRFKSKIADMNEEAKEMEESIEDSDTEDDEIDDDSEAEEVEKRRERREQRRAEFREYELNRQKNVEDLKNKLRAFKEDLTAKHPELKPARTPTSKKDLDKPVGRVRRRSSQRIKHRT